MDCRRKEMKLFFNPHYKQISNSANAIVNKEITRVNHNLQNHLASKASVLHWRTHSFVIHSNWRRCRYDVLTLECSGTVNASST